MTRISRWMLALGVAASAAGCGGPVATTDAGGDASSACRGADDGAACGDGRICAGGACAASICGDGIVDDRTEQCDDGNDAAFDGCEPTLCTFTCMLDEHCNDLDECNGEETCDAGDHVCIAGTTLADLAVCTSAAVSEGVCVAGRCFEPGCGNGALEAGETCDDGNDDPHDGCTPECEYTCTTDLDCQDPSLCNGVERCELSTHVCGPGIPVECIHTSSCVNDVCDDALGCVSILIDGDEDGHASTLLGACGDDCDDRRPDVYTGAEELCDGDDNDCDTIVDEAAPTWFVDCDRDGYAPEGAISLAQCDAPPDADTGCEGTWVTLNPTDPASRDCDDADAGRSPAATELVGDEIDTDCDGGEICYLDGDDDGHRPPDGTTYSSADSDCDDRSEAAEVEPATDCCDSDARVFPAATRPQSTASACGGFDFDCDGMEMQTLTVGRATCGSGCTPSPSVGWTGTVPACGVSATWLYDCATSFSGCRGSTTTRAQPCL